VRAPTSASVTERARHGAISIIRIGGCIGIRRGDVQMGHAMKDAKRQDAIAHTPPAPISYDRRHDHIVKAKARRVAKGEP
jgi:hypothetical protein